jgi:hypothetical protein
VKNSIYSRFVDKISIEKSKDLNSRQLWASKIIKNRKRQKPLQNSPPKKT